jgi:hypothetical protein
MNGKLQKAIEAYEKQAQAIAIRHDSSPSLAWVWTKEEYLAARSHIVAKGGKLILHLGDRPKFGFIAARQVNFEIREIGQ